MSEKKFNIRMAEAGEWKSILNALDALIDEAVFDFSGEGLRCRAMDPSHVAMVDMELPKTYFDDYMCGESAKICFNVGRMIKLLKRPGKASLELASDASRLTMLLKRTAYKRTFTMTTLDPYGETIPAPKISFNTSIKMISSNLRHALMDIDTVTDFVTVAATNDHMVFLGKGPLNEVKIEFPRDCDFILGLEAKEPSTATYDLNYLMDIVKAGSQLSDITTWNFSTDMPIRLDFELPQKGKLQYYIAPRIERE